jgi:hypothetical protein
MTRTIYAAYNATQEIGFLVEADAIKHASDNIGWQTRQYEQDIPGMDAANDQAILDRDMIFGKLLVYEFLLDNRLMPAAITPQDSLQLLSKFNVVAALCDKGDIKSVNALLPGIVIDNLFTQERKDKYIAMVTDHLAQNV